MDKRYSGRLDFSRAPADRCGTCGNASVSHGASESGFPIVYYTCHNRPGREITDNTLACPDHSSGNCALVIGINEPYPEYNEDAVITSLNRKIFDSLSEFSVTLQHDIESFVTTYVQGAMAALREDMESHIEEEKELKRRYKSKTKSPHFNLRRRVLWKRKKLKAQKT